MMTRMLLRAYVNAAKISTPVLIVAAIVAHFLGLL